VIGQSTAQIWGTVLGGRDHRNFNMAEQAVAGLSLFSPLMRPRHIAARSSAVRGTSAVMPGSALANN
jgi:hypothetical protein